MVDIIKCSFGFFFNIIISSISTLKSFRITSQSPRFCLPVFIPEVRTHYPQISTRASGSGKQKTLRVQATARKLCRRTSRISAKFMCSNHTVHPNYNHTHARVNSRSRFEVSVRIFGQNLGKFGNGERLFKQESFRLSVLKKFI